MEGPNPLAPFPAGKGYSGHQRGRAHGRESSGRAYYGWAEKVNLIGQGGRLESLVTGSLQNLTYTYDEIGNVKVIEDDVADEKSEYLYTDGLNRLTNWTLFYEEQQVSAEAYTYNETTGNLASKAGVDYTYNSGHAPLRLMSQGLAMAA